jgi:23S rRNA (cytidine1920-2'-O)/16S rRNA (cytidine1409-2'-O)-methyltransferase
VTKKRLDLLLVERGLAETRAQAQALVMAGLVPGHSKPGEQVDEATPLEVEHPPPYVSRAGHKLANALDAFGVDPAGLDCLDVGASTGGFTDCLLQHGAAHVIALDVGYGQLDAKLRSDPRVRAVERVNAREMSAEHVPAAPPVELVVVDVSFISATLVLPRIAALAPRAELLVMVKPQFEVGRERVGKGGVVRDDADRAAAVDRVRAAALALGYEPRGVADSRLAGPAGNREVFLWLAPQRRGED